MVAHRKVRLEEIAPGSVLATSLFDGQRTQLLEKGAELDAAQIESLREQGVKEVVVEWPTQRAPIE